MYPAPPSLLAFVPEPLLAGVIGGVCFLFVAIILSLVTACVMSHRRERRRRKRRDGKANSGAAHTGITHTRTSSDPEKYVHFCFSVLS